MGGPKPCLGYPSRTAAVAALSAQGLPTAEIAQRINAEAPDDPVSDLNVCRLRYEGNQRRRIATLPITLSAAEHDRLKSAALARGTTVPRLATRLIRVALADALIEAILDDTGGDQ